MATAKAEKPKKAKKEAKPKAKAKKAAKTKEKPKAKAKAKAKAKRPRLKRGMAMNKWERWLCQFFEELDEGAEVHNKELTEKIKPYVEEQEGPKDIRRVILNSVRRLVKDGWIERSARGSYKVTDKVAKLAANKDEIAKKSREVREATPWSRQHMADLLGHPSRGRYATLEQGRRPMHIWEAYTISRVLELEIP